jgi:DNA polymerase (family 10)
MKAPASHPLLSNAEIARRLSAYAQTLVSKGENPFKVRAYRRAAQTIKSLRENVAQLVSAGADVTRFPGIGKGIAAALREIIASGTVGQMELLLPQTTPEVAAANDYPSLDPKRIARVFKKLKIETIAQLKVKLEEGAIAAAFGARMADHIRNALRETTEILLDDADVLAREIENFLRAHCGVTRVEVSGDVRRRVETVSGLEFVVETTRFSETLKRFAAFRGGIDLIETANRDATFQLPGSVMVTLHGAIKANWGSTLVATTGSHAHIEELEKIGGLSRRARNEDVVYTTVGLPWIPPELREGRGEVAQAARGELPQLVELADIRGDLHMHTTSSDGQNSIEEMAEAAKALGYSYIGITDHSRSLRIAGGLSTDDLWKQIRRIDKLNNKIAGIRILKSAEVDILADGSLDYPDDLLAELDYTVCSIHSRFRLSRSEQTERIMRAMDHPAFSILGHATGRLLLNRSGYDLDFPRIIQHARARKCYFEINADPDRLDLSPEHVREVAKAGIKVAIGTDAHRRTGLGYMHCGLDVARRAGLEKSAVLNTGTLTQLLRALVR